MKIQNTKNKIILHQSIWRWIKKITYYNSLQKKINKNSFLFKILQFHDYKIILFFIINNKIEFVIQFNSMLHKTKYNIILNIM